MSAHRQTSKSARREPPPKCGFKLLTINDLMEVISTADESERALPKNRSYMGSVTAARAALAVLVGSFLLLFRDVILKLVHDWGTDDN